MQKYRMGWLPDRPDFRDYSIETTVEKLKNQLLSPPREVIKLEKATFAEDDNSPLLDRAIHLLGSSDHNGHSKSRRQKSYLLLPLKTQPKPNQDNSTQTHSARFRDLYLPESVDLREWFSPVETQAEINSCTALAGVALVEYFQQRSFGEYIDASPLFLYKVTRKLMQLTGDSGASIRQTMRAMALFGIPPEEYWPYKIEAFDEEPPAFCYAFAQNYQALSYFEIDQPQLSKEEILVRIRIALAAGFPAIFGFAAHSSLFYEKTAKSGKIAYPVKGEKAEGAHAVVAVGYNDNKTIKNSKSRGAFRIRNCWGSEWGKNGYGWLPYDYVLDGLTSDWWSLVKSEWIASENFGLTIDPHGLLIGERQPRGLTPPQPSPLPPDLSDDNDD